MKKHVILFNIIFLILAPASFASLDISGIGFDERVQVEGVSLEARGGGILKFAYLFDIYAGVLYLPGGLDPEDALGDVPKRLEVQYLREIAGEDFGKAASEYIEKNVGPEKFQLLEPRIRAHNSLYVDVAPGDRYALTYIPGKGAELSFNDKPLGTVEGADFAEALFSIWLGKHPISERFKEALLGY